MAYASMSEWLPNLQHWFTTIDVFHVPTSTAFTSSTSTSRLPRYTAIDIALPLRNHLLDFGHLRQHLRLVVDTPSDLVKFHRSIYGNRTLNSSTPARSMAWTFQRPSDQASSPTTKTLKAWTHSRFLSGNSCIRACRTSGYDELPMAAKPMSSRLTILELRYSLQSSSANVALETSTLIALQLTNQETREPTSTEGSHSADGEGHSPTHSILASHYTGN